MSSGGSELAAQERRYPEILESVRRDASSLNLLGQCFASQSAAVHVLGDRPVKKRRTLEGSELRSSQPEIIGHRILLVKV